MGRPQRSSDLVETYSARALAAGIGGLVALAVAVFFYIFRGDSNAGLPLAIVIAVIGVASIVFACVSLVQVKKVSSFKLTCPMCGATNGFAEMPASDVTCAQCHRTIPIEDGKILPLNQVSCNYCHESNWYSAHTKTLLCEACGREIAIARPDGSPEAHSSFAVQDDARPYELVLSAYGRDTEGLIGALQQHFGLTRAQAKVIMGELPHVLVTNVPRQKAEMLRLELSRHEAAVEARPVA